MTRHVSSPHAAMYALMLLGKHALRYVLSHPHIPPKKKHHHSHLAPQIAIVNQMTTLVNAKRDSDGNTRVSAALGVFACASCVPFLTLQPNPRAHAPAGLSWEHAPTTRLRLSRQVSKKSQLRRLRAVCLTFQFRAINLHRPTESVLRSSSSQRRLFQGRRGSQVGACRRLSLHVSVALLNPEARALRSELARRARQAAGERKR